MINGDTEQHQFKTKNKLGGGGEPIKISNGGEQLSRRQG